MTFERSRFVVDFVGRPGKKDLVAEGAATAVEFQSGMNNVP